MAPEYENAASDTTALSAEQKSRWTQACWTLFAEYLGDEKLEFFKLTDAELDEIVAASNELAAEFGIEAPREKWIIYADFMRHLICQKRLKSRRCALGAFVINSMTFFWDDVDESQLDKKHLVLKKTYEMCGRYYRPEHKEFVFSHIRQWLDTDSFTREHPKLRENLCLKHGITGYWQFRLIDSGCPLWYAITGPCYENPDFLMLSFNLAHIALKPIMVVNDVFSYAREEKNQENANFLHHTKHLNAAAKDAVMNEHLDAMRKDLDTLLDFDEPLREIMLHTSFGNLVGSAYTVRYIGD